ncbi:hypothetical protein Pst134EA_022550 [Puccinia striiformis f. sp. tritici]|uniref:hypothetical protein n=1 Tax=Puccinia striiformis f. sp. tritici TaxID=168172 RepID=UPI002008AAB5|nr:hypothetical protein Pst134EA_022550 [Puccinia striiformis f. sp. tritici]KAH9455074.1 hypothetical protein Pst134EA_022550 [Puccinia striiformis f. sp. tritici]
MRPYALIISANSRDVEPQVQALQDELECYDHVNRCHEIDLTSQHRPNQPHQDCRRSKLLTDWTLKSQQPTSALRTIEAPPVHSVVGIVSTSESRSEKQQLHEEELPHSEALEPNILKEHFEIFLSRALSKEVPTVPRYDTQSGLSTSDLKLRSNPSLFNNCTATLPANLNPGGTWKADAPVYESLFPPGATKKSSLKIDSNRLTFYCQDDPTETSDNPLIKQLTPIETKWELA